MTPSSGPRRPHRDDGSALDATFELSSVPVFELTFHHKAGGRGSPIAVNQDYNEALELLLKRLFDMEATILGIALDSSVGRELPPEERELPLGYPIRLRPGMNEYDLRLEISRAQKTVGRSPTARPGGGNGQKRILITLALERDGVDYEDLLNGLAADRPR